MPVDNVAGCAPCRYCSPHHRMPFDSRNEGSKRASMTWRVTCFGPCRTQVTDVDPLSRQSMPLFRGLHSFRFQLNLSSSVHRVNQLNS